MNTEAIKEFMWKTLTDEQKILFDKVLAGAITRKAPLITHLAPRAALKIEINLIPINNEKAPNIRNNRRSHESG